ncbi:MAG: Tyrosine recombinase XerC [Chlamydiales bacterium]|nr:Tyrosine recombinase XerC [Chlamydiales bacterium]
MGTIFPRKTKNGKIRYLARVRRQGGQYTAKTFGTKTDAQIWISATETAMNQGTYSHVAESKKHKVAQLIDRYIQSELPKKPKSLEKQTQQLLWWKKRIGHYLLANITPALLVECQEELLGETTVRGSKRSPSTVNRYMAAFSHALSVAYKHWQWIHRNPFLKVPKLKEPKGRDRILSDNETAALLQACKESASPYLYLIVRIALATGARKSEIMNLKWSDIDLKTGRAILHETKNGSTRSLYLPRDIIRMLEEIYKNQKIQSFLLFPGTNSTQPTDIRTAWELALKRAGIKDFVFHSLRHHAASTMAAMGASDVELRSFLGHKSPSMVLRYAHYRESALAETINRMNQRIEEIEGNVN